MRAEVDAPAWPVLELAYRVARAAAHEVRRHPAPADVDRRDHLQLALEHEAQPEPVGATDDRVGHRVVDDARVAHEDSTGPGAASRVPDSNVRLKSRRTPSRWPPDHAGAGGRRGAARARVAPARHPMSATRDAAQLAEQKPPRHCHQPHADPRLAPDHPQHEVDGGRGGQQQRQHERHDGEGHRLDHDAARTASKAGTARTSVRQERSHAWHRTGSQCASTGSPTCDGSCTPPRSSAVQTTAATAKIAADQ